MGYFAARSAPFGEVPADVVTAAFYNFAPERVAKALPGAWDVAPPAAALRAREQSAVAALRRYGVTDDDAAVAAELAARAAQSGDLGGRTLFAANRALAWPEGHSPGCGTRSRCCVNTAATATWPCWRPGGNAHGPESR